MEKKAIQAVIFDMDGLMFDTERLAAVGWKRAGEALGFSITERELQMMRGRSAREGRRLFSEWYQGRVEYEEAKKYRTAYVNQYIEEHGTPVKEGLLELFSYLKKQGIPKAIATATSRENAIWYFERAGIPFDFEESVCGAEVENGKPAPDIFLAASQKLNVKPPYCLVLEDSLSGVEAGCAAGSQVIMVPDLAQPGDSLKKRCLAVCKNLTDVISYLD